MKKPICVIATFVAMSLSTSAFAWDSPHQSEAACLKLAEFAGGMAKVKQDGVPEQMTIDHMTKGANPQAAKVMTTVIKLVYLLELDIVESKRAVYAKCRAGAFVE